MLRSTDFALFLAVQPGMSTYFPATPALSSDARFLTCAGNTLPITFDGYGMDETSGPYVLVGVTGYAPTEAERTIDRPLVSVAIVGPQDDHAGAEQITSDVDDALMGVTPTASIPSSAAFFDAGADWGSYSSYDGPVTDLISLDYVGGDPRFLQRDAARRSIFTGEYVLRIPRTVF